MIVQIVSVFGHCKICTFKILLQNTFLGKGGYIVICVYRSKILS